jgi:hypothetical protein
MKACEGGHLNIATYLVADMGMDVNAKAKVSRR